MGKGGRVGDWIVFCHRGHNCWASEASQQGYNKQWTCNYHWEMQHELDRVPAPAHDEMAIEVGRGADNDYLTTLLPISCTAASRQAVAGLGIAGCMVSGLNVSVHADRQITEGTIPAIEAGTFDDQEANTAHIITKHTE